MYNTQRNDKKGGFKKYGQAQPWKREFDSRGFAKPEMHDATCAECGNACQVPFKPNGRKPIYCSNCFKKEGGNETRSFDRRPDSRGFNTLDKPMFQATCDNCHNDCEVPFRPTGERPVYCRACFGKADGGNRQERTAPQRPETRTVEYRIDEFKKLNEKLDAIMAVLRQAAPAAKAAVVEDSAKASPVAKAMGDKPADKPTKKKAAAKKKK